MELYYYTINYIIYTTNYIIILKRRKEDQNVLAFFSHSQKSNYITYLLTPNPIIVTVKYIRQITKIWKKGQKIGKPIDFVIVYQ